MKKLFSAILALMLAVPSFAQFASGGFELDKANLYYGVRFGLAMGKLTGDTEIGTMDYSGMKAGMTLGAVLGLRLSSSAPVFLESGLYYTQRGGKDGKYTADMNCLEIPLLVKYGFQASDKIAVLPFVGPYFAYGIAGETEYLNALGEKEKERTYKNFLNHNDMGFKLGCGFEFNMLYMEVAYQLGIANVSDRDDYSLHANQLSVNFGVNF